MNFVPHGVVPAMVTPFDQQDRLNETVLQALALRLLAARRLPSDLDGPALLGERAAIFGLSRRGTTAPGGSCRLVRCADGWIAVNLARTDDLVFVEAGELDLPGVL